MALRTAGRRAWHDATTLGIALFAFALTAVTVSVRKKGGSREAIATPHLHAEAPTNVQPSSLPVPSTEISLSDLFEIELRAGLEEEVQKELAELMNLAPDVERCGQRHLLVPLRYAIKAILLEPANLSFAADIRKDIQERVRAVPVLRGLALLLGVVAALVLLLSEFGLPKTMFGFSRSTLLLVVVAGALGAVVSILVRIREFVVNPERSSMWMGLFRPVIGIVFALFTFMAVESGLVPVTIEKGKESATYAVIGFIAGFSERFVRDVIRSTETRIVPLPSGTTIRGASRPSPDA